MWDKHPACQIRQARRLTHIETPAEQPFPAGVFYFCSAPALVRSLFRSDVV